MNPRKANRREPYICTCKYFDEHQQIHPLQTTAAEDATEVAERAENASAIGEAQ